MASEGKRGNGRFEFKPTRQRSFCNGRVNMERMGKEGREGGIEEEVRGRKRGMGIGRKEEDGEKRKRIKKRWGNEEEEKKKKEESEAFIVNKNFMALSRTC